MARILLSMRWTTLRRTMTWRRGAVQVATIGAGLAIVLAGTAAAAGAEDSAGAGDFLAVALLLWTFGWIAASAVTPGAGDGLHADYFALLPLSPRRLAANLLATSFVGIAPAMSLFAFAVLLGYGAWLGPSAAIVALPAFVLQWLLAILLCRALTATLAGIATSRTRAVLMAIPWAVAISLMGQTWAVLRAIEEGGATFSSYATFARAVPAGWGLVAVEAADTGDWWQALLAMTGLGTVVGFVAWVAVVATSRQNAALRPPSVSANLAFSAALDRALPESATGATMRKELLTWSRDTTRIYYVAWGVFYAVAYCTFQLIIGVDTLVPWGGTIAAVGLAATAAHLYSSDGTALWLTLMTPHAVGADVRGRQLAWLLVVAPAVVLVSFAGLAIARDAYAWPWVLALLPAVIGGGAGLLIAISAFILVPMTDPHHRAGRTDGGGNLAGVIWIMLGVLCIPVAVPTIVVGAGTSADSALLTWAGVPVGIAMGAGFGWLMGHIAALRLEARGPESLHRLRSGSSSKVAGTGKSKPAAAST